MTFDIPTIVSPQACQQIILRTSPLVIMTSIATSTIIVALEAVLVINMTTGTAIVSQPLMTAEAKVTMPNTVTDLDQEHDYDQGPILVTLEAQDTIMVTTFIIMTTGEENRRFHLLLPLIQVWAENHLLLEPNHLQFNIRIRLLNQSLRQNPPKLLRLFLSKLSQGRYNGYHAHLILFLHLLQTI